MIDKRKSSGESTPTTTPATTRSSKDVDHTRTNVDEDGLDQKWTSVVSNLFGSIRQLNLWQKFSRSSVDISKEKEPNDPGEYTKDHLEMALCDLKRKKVSTSRIALYNGQKVNNTGEKKKVVPTNKDVKDTMKLMEMTHEYTCTKQSNVSVLEHEMSTEITYPVVVTNSDFGAQNICDVNDQTTEIEPEVLTTSIESTTDKVQQSMETTTAGLQEFLKSSDMIPSIVPPITSPQENVLPTTPIETPEVPDIPKPHQLKSKVPVYKSPTNNNNESTSSHSSSIFGINQQCKISKPSSKNKMSRIPQRTNKTLPPSPPLGSNNERLTSKSFVADSNLEKIVFKPFHPSDSMINVDKAEMRMAADELLEKQESEIAEKGGQRPSNPSDTIFVEDAPGAAAALTSKQLYNCQTIDVLMKVNCSEATSIAQTTHTAVHIPEVIDHQLQDERQKEPEVEINDIVYINDGAPRKCTEDASTTSSDLQKHAQCQAEDGDDETSQELYKQQVYKDLGVFEDVIVEEPKEVTEDPEGDAMDEMAENLRQTLERLDGTHQHQKKLRHQTNIFQRQSQMNVRIASRTRLSTEYGLVNVRGERSVLNLSYASSISHDDDEDDGQNAIPEIQTGILQKRLPTLTSSQESEVSKKDQDLKQEVIQEVDGKVGKETVEEDVQGVEMSLKKKVLNEQDAKHLNLFMNNFNAQNKINNIIVMRRPYSKLCMPTPSTTTYNNYAHFNATSSTNQCRCGNPACRYRSAMTYHCRCGNPACPWNKNRNKSCQDHYQYQYQHWQQQQQQYSDANQKGRVLSAQMTNQRTTRPSVGSIALSPQQSIILGLPSMPTPSLPLFFYGHRFSFKSSTSNNNPT